jgi:hypothetical protein
MSEWQRTVLRVCCPALLWHLCKKADEAADYLREIRNLLIQSRRDH